LPQCRNKRLTLHNVLLLRIRLLHNHSSDNQKNISYKAQHEMTVWNFLFKYDGVFMRSFVRIFSVPSLSTAVEDRVLYGEWIGEPCHVETDQSPTS